MTTERLVTFGIFFYIVEIQYLCLLTLVKLTLSVFYLRIFPGKTIGKLLWGTVIFHIIFGAGFILKATFQCSPIQYSWMRYDASMTPRTHGQCININTSSWVHAVGNVAVDFWLIALPLTQLRSLNLHWKQRLGAIVMFMTGLLYVLLINIAPLATSFWTRQHFVQLAMKHVLLRQTNNMALSGSQLFLFFDSTRSKNTPSQQTRPKTSMTLCSGRQSKSTLA
jgi:hypothetical protein